MADPVKTPPAAKEWTKEELAKIETFEKKAQQFSSGLIVTGVWNAKSTDRALFEAFDPKQTVNIGEVTEKGDPTGKFHLISGAEYRYNMTLMAVYANTDKMDERIAAIDKADMNPKLTDEQKQKLQAGKQKIIAAKKLVYKELFDQETEPKDAKTLVAGIKKIEEAAKIFAGEVLGRPAPMVTPKTAGSKGKENTSIFSPMTTTLPGDTLNAIDSIKASLVGGGFNLSDSMTDMLTDIESLEKQVLARKVRDKKTETSKIVAA